MADLRYQKSLLFVMTRAGQWQKLTAMKFSVVSLASYSAVRKLLEQDIVFITENCKYFVITDLKYVVFILHLAEDHL